MNRIVLIFALVSSSAEAETIQDAILSAYATNPSLGAARARQTAVGESLEQATAAGRLTTSVDGGAGYDRFSYGKGFTATASASIPIWAGGRIKTALRAARGEVAAGQEGLRDIEASVLEAVVVTYASLLYDQQAASIAKADIDLLGHEASETNERFRLGNATRTDVARLEAQRAGAVATLASAESTLATDIATYRALVGRDPGSLSTPPDGLAALPGSLAEARELAIASNPVYLENQRLVDAANARVDEARANGAPFVSVGAAYGRGLNIAQRSDSGFPLVANAGVTVHFPVLTGGLIASQVRQARAEFQAAELDRAAGGREVVRAVEQAWANLASARQQIEADAQSVGAADLALKGVRAEYVFSLRTTLDILVADESLRGAQLALARARRDALIAQAALLRATGRLNETSFDTKVFKGRTRGPTDP